jgi:hypothetical protein
MSAGMHHALQAMCPMCRRQEVKAQRKAEEKAQRAATQEARRAEAQVLQHWACSMGEYTSFCCMLAVVCSHGPASQSWGTVCMLRQLSRLSTDMSQARNASMTEEQRAAHHAEKVARLAARRQEAADKKERQNKVGLKNISLLVSSLLAGQAAVVSVSQSETTATPVQALTQGQRLVVDLDFEGLMTPAEVSSICNQLMHSYSANSRAAVPCHLHFTSVKVLRACF